MRLYQDSAMPTEIEKVQDNETQKKSISWIKKLGFAGFMFFFIKGMAWVVLAVIAWIWGPEAVVAIKDFFVNLF